MVDISGGSPPNSQNLSDQTLATSVTFTIMRLSVAFIVLASIMAVVASPAGDSTVIEKRAVSSGELNDPVHHALADC